MKEKSELVFDSQFEREVNSWNVHDSLKDRTLEELRALQPNLNFAVAALNVEKGLNIGSMIRTAVCFGASEFILVGDKKYDKRSTVGAQNYINVVKETSENLLNYLHQKGYYPVFIEQGGMELVSNKAKLTFLPGKPCFVFGSEGEGIPDIILNDRSFFPDKYMYTINQFGVLRSLNVSVALGIILHSIYNEGY